MLFVFALAVMTIGLAVALVAPRAGVYLVIFFVSWNGLDIDFGLRVTVFQLLMLPLLLVTILRSALPGLQPPPLPAATLLGLFVLQAVIWSLLQLGFIPIYAVGDSALRGPTARAVVQIVMFLFTISPAIVITCWLRTAEDAARGFRIYLCSLVVLSLLGWLQVTVKYATGIDPYPIGALNVALGGSASIWEREGQFVFEALNIYRMNSFAGEPRNLGVALSIGMVSLQMIALIAPRRPGIGMVILYAFLLVTLLATFSTSGIGAWLVGTAASLPLLWLTRTRIARRSASLAIGGAALVGVCLAGIVALETNNVPVLDLLAERTIDRIAQDGAVEDFDLAITDYFRAEPVAMITGTGLGNAHLYASPFLDPLFALYAEGSVFIGKTGLIRTVSEIGLIGLALLMAWFGRLTFSVANLRNASVSAAPGAAPLAVVPMIAFLLSSLFQSEVFIAAGLLAAVVVGARSASSQNERSAAS